MLSFAEAMCRVREASCRLCLSKKSIPPLLDLSENSSLASLITEVLSLRFSLSSDKLRDTSHPRHVCHVCHDTIQSFVKLRAQALKNEESFHESQNTMTLSSVPMTSVNKFSDDDEDYSKEDHHDLCDDFSEPFLPDKTVIKTEEENSNNLPIKISFIKVEKKVKKPRILKTELPKDSAKPMKGKGSRPRTEHTMRARAVVKQLILELGPSYTPDTLLTCPTCGYTRTKHYLTKHIKWVHKEADIPCEIEGCKWSFKKHTDMKIHMKIVHFSSKEQCSICGGHFKNLDNHVKVKHLG